MIQDMEPSNEAVVPSIEDAAFDPKDCPIDYDQAFPKLSGVKDAGSVPGSGPWNQRPLLRSRNVTQVFTVPMEERRFKEMNENRFGEESSQAKTCKEIMTKTGVSIEMSLAKDQSLTLVIHGKEESVMKARREVVTRLQTQANVVMNIPKEHHKFILGKNGKKLQDLELATATKISITRFDDSNEIRISGIKEGIERARHEIQCISDEQAKLAYERLNIPKVFHAFCCGPNNQITKQLMDETGARINVPPQGVNKDEISISGEKEGVLKCKAALLKIFEEKKRKCQTVSVEVKKSQHKYVIGQRGCNITEILGATGVAVEVPPLESTSETITLRGEQDKLGPALTMVYSKANSVVFTEIKAPAWLHRFIIGRKGENVRKITESYPKVHIEFTEEKDRIEVEGPPEEVDGAYRALELVVNDLKSRMSFAEVEINQKFHKHIIGKAGANITRIKNETGVAIRVPGDAEKSNRIRIEGDPKGVEKAKVELLEMATRMENEKTKDIIIEQRFHKTIIGARGEKIKEVRDRFPQVQITFPDQDKKSEVVSLRGPRNDVDKCHKYMQQMHNNLIESSFEAQVRIFKDFHKNVIGKSGQTIRKIRDETATRIDLPSETSDSDIIVITGKKANVEAAKLKIEAIQKDLANIKEISVDIPHKLHQSLIGTKGRLVRAIMDECGGVVIRFPPEGSNSDKVTIRGPIADIENAKKQLLEVSNEKQISSFNTEVQAKSEFHKFLIGKNGANIRKVRESTGARIIFPSPQDTNQETIVLIGKEDSVNKAKAQLLELIKNLENIVEEEIHVDSKHHRYFVAKQGLVLRGIGDDYGGVTVSFPRAGVKSDVVVLKGSKDCVEGAKKRIQELVEDQEAQVTIDCVILQKYHRTVMGAKGSNVQAVTRDFGVTIKFPDRPMPNGGQVQNQQSQNQQSRNQQSQNPQSPNEQSQNPQSQNPQSPNQQSQNPQSPNQQSPNQQSPNQQSPNQQSPNQQSPIQQSPSQEPAVNGDVSSEDGDDKQPKKTDIITISGKQENCEAAKNALMELVPITDEVSIPFDFHRFIIGQKGRDVRSMMQDFEVNISVPPADEKSDVVRVTGPPANNKRAIEALNEKVVMLEKEKEEKVLKSFSIQVDVPAKYHPKIIGRKGAVITKIRNQHDVLIQFPDYNSEGDQSMITITGYETRVHGAKDDIMKIVNDLEQQVTRDIRIDQRVHPRIIGARGRNVNRIMEDYKVDIRFPKGEDCISVSGDEEAVNECCDHLFNLEEEYLQEVIDQEYLRDLQRAPSKPHDDSDRHRKRDPGFVVGANAPWNTPDSAPDTTSTDEFPSFGAAVSSKSSSKAWGPIRKK